MLLDPFEEQLDLPATTVKLGDGDRRLGEVVGQEDEVLAGVRIGIANAPQSVRVLPMGAEPGQDDRLVETDAGGFVHGRRVASSELEVGLGTRDEERRSAVNTMESSEVHIPPGLWGQPLL